MCPNSTCELRLSWTLCRFYLPTVVLCLKIVEKDQHFFCLLTAGVHWESCDPVGRLWPVNLSIDRGVPVCRHTSGGLGFHTGGCRIGHRNELCGHRCGVPVRFYGKLGTENHEILISKQGVSVRKLLLTGMPDIGVLITWHGQTYLVSQGWSFALTNLCYNCYTNGKEAIRLCPQSLYT